MKDLIKLQEEKGMFDFIKLGKYHPLYSKKKAEIVGNFIIETLETKYMDNFCVFRSKAYAYSISNAKQRKKT